MKTQTIEKNELKNLISKELTAGKLTYPLQ